jgi:7-cyano-7-deazaguanine synthase
MYDAICLASGGLDSSLCLQLLHEESIEALPVYINYGQLNFRKEWKALSEFCEFRRFPQPVTFDIRQFGKVIRTGLTDATQRVNEDAFTPNRNLLFLTLASSFAYTKGVRNIVIGLLAEKTTIFPDQTDSFLRSVEGTLSESLGSAVFIHSPLRDFTKQDVVKLARLKGITSYYSCHAGGDKPCGVCIACREYE